MRWKLSLFFIILLLGVTARIYLALTLPIWHDEAYSIWASHESLSRILSGATDPVHPPGYYLLLKTLSFISGHLIWYRGISIILSVLNIILCYLLAKRLTKNQLTYPFICAVLYAYSGYFIIFDWQARMYTGVSTLILGSFLMYCHLLQNKNPVYKIIFFTILNIIGLYFDYGFLWYLLPVILLTACFAFIKKQTNVLPILASLLASGIGFGMIYPQVFVSYQRGIEGILWMKDYLRPSYFIPFFLGTHQQMIITGAHTALLTYGLYVWYRNLPNLKYFTYFISLGFVSGYVTFIYSNIFSPLFHERSLQIIGLGILFIFAISLQSLISTRKWTLLGIATLCIFINFFIITWSIPIKPYIFLLSYFPWKSTKTLLDKQHIRSVLIYPQPNLPTPILLWGLEYTLQGKESLFSNPIPYTVISNNASVPQSCKLMNENLIRVYGCT